MRDFKSGICFPVNRVPLILEMIKQRLNQQLSCGLGKSVHVHVFHSMTHAGTKRDISTNAFTPFLSVFLLPPFGRDWSPFQSMGISELVFSFFFTKLGGYCMSQTCGLFIQMV